jgi:hypothetical protein
MLKADPNLRMYAGNTPPRRAEHLPVSRLSGAGQPVTAPSEALDTSREYLAIAPLA